LLVRSLLVDHLQVRRLTAEPGAVVDDFAVDFPGCEVDETQRLSSNADTPSGAVRLHVRPFWRLGLFISHGRYAPQVTQVTPASESRRFNSSLRPEEVTRLFGGPRWLGKALESAHRCVGIR